MKYAFTDYNTVRPHSSINYLPTEEFEKRWNEDWDFRKEFLENRKRKDERRVNNRNEKKRRLREISHWITESLSRIKGADQFLSELLFYPYE